MRACSLPLGCHWSLHVSCFCWRAAKVPCSHVVEMAKAQVESNPHASPALKEFARIRPEDAETACHEVLTKYGFSVPIPVETLNIGPGQLKACPFVRPSAWATYLLNKGILPRQLVGVADRAQMEETLREHWKRYQVLFPNHPIFRLALEGTVQLQRCVPILSHSDEGRSTKHLPLFVMSFHGVCAEAKASCTASSTTIWPQFSWTIMGNTIFVLCHSERNG